MLLLLEKYHQNCQAVLAATGLNGLKDKVCSDPLSSFSSGLLLYIMRETAQAEHVQWVLAAGCFGADAMFRALHHTKCVFIGILKMFVSEN